MKIDREYRKWAKQYLPAGYYRIQHKENPGRAWIVVASLFTGLAIILAVSLCHAEEVNLAKIAMIESSGNPLAHNKTDDSRGLFQITPIVLKEWNQFNTPAYRPDNLWNPSVNTRVASWYLNKRIPQMLRHFKISDTIENRLIAYNAGIFYLAKKKPLPKITKRYLKRYRTL